MALYSYRATSKTGSVVEGVIEAADERAAIERLRSSNLIPIKISLPGGGLKLAGGKGFSLKRQKGDLISFTSELSALLNAGLPLDRSLNILAEISEGREMKEATLAILRSIREGASFSDSLQKHPRIFPRLYVSMVRAGEAGGVLDVVLDKLNEFLESSKELKDHLFSAMIYPSILLITGGLSIVVLLTYVLPKFTSIFDELGGGMPLPTQILLAISDGMRSYWWVFALTIVLAVVFVRASARTEAGKYQLDNLKLKLMGDIIRKLEVARFCRTLGTLLKSGVPILQALNNAKGVVGNQVISSSIDAVSRGIKEGKGIAGPLSQTGHFPTLALSMIKVGEETGQLDAMLLRIATVYEKALRNSIKRFVSLVEPAMILGMGVVIGFIVVSMLTAIFSITELPF
ncbi:MAG: type II secretion system F family protein [Nitrospirales bacterium]|nr:type II secretion system F family protein [Nitrospirales bacterium]